MNEIELTNVVRQAQGGDARAFDCLVREYQNPAVAFARSLLRGYGQAAAEDAAQEAFVEAWRGLPSLRVPEAFPAWLRRIVFKHCDRERRRSAPFLRVPLDEAFHIAGGAEPATAAEESADAARVRATLDGLPEREREAALLYYLGGRDLAEIGAFLSLPKTTVKNRLHAARGRLRKELWEMAEQVLEKERPSRDEAFAGRVLQRLMEEFRRQMRADPHTADRALLDEAQAQLDDALAAPGPLDWDTARWGFDLLWRRWDHKANAALLTRFLAQPLDDGRTAWAWFFLSNCLAICGEPAGAVLASDAFEKWLPGRAPRLSVHWPYLPADADSSEEVHEGEEVWLLFLGKSGEFALSWKAVWREDEYLDKIDAALDRAAKSPARNPTPRFICMRMACMLCEESGRFDRGRSYVNRIYALAEEQIGEAARAEWRAKALGHDIRMRLMAGDTDGAVRKARETADLLRANEKAPWTRGERHDLAHHLIRLGLYEEALPLLDANLALGSHANEWGWFIHAAVVWKVNHDRERTLHLLREATTRDDRDRTDELLRRPEFADVREDPEFLQAVRRA